MPNRILAPVTKALVRGCFALCAIGAAACRDSTAPPPPGGLPGLRIVAGDGAIDTIGAVVSQAVIAELRDNDGRPIAGAIVQFESLENLGDPWLWVRRLDADFFKPSVVDTTDANGRAKAQVELGYIAGSALLRITSAAVEAVDTVRFTVSPGQASRVMLTPRDATVYPGATAAIHPTVVDAKGNLRVGDRLTFEVVDGAVSVDAAGVVTTSSTPTRAHIVARFGGLTDTLGLSVVPQGRLAAVYTPPTGAAQIAVVDLDGTHLTPLTGLQTTIGIPSWRPDGAAIAFVDAVGTSDRGRIFSVDLQGTRRQLLQSPDSIIGETDPRYSADGQWIYFACITSSGSFRLARAHSDGSAVEVLPFSGGSVTFGSQPSPSPDGSRLIFTSNNSLYVMNLSSSAITLVGAGSAARWSPNGDRVAYLAAGSGYPSGALTVMNADGSGAHLVSTVHHYDGSFEPTWTPDGNFIVIRGPTTTELVEVATGAVIPLSFGTRLYQPAAQP